MQHLLDYIISGTLSGLQNLLRRISSAQPARRNTSELEQERREEDDFLQGQLDELDRQARIRRLPPPSSAAEEPSTNGVVSGHLMSGPPSNDDVLRILEIIGKPSNGWN